MSMRELDRRRRARARAAGDVRRRARLGALLPDRVRRRAVADAVGGRRAARAASPAATGRSTRCGSRRATASGPPTSRPTRRRTRRGLGFCVRSTRRSSARDALRRRPSRAGRLRCLVLDDPRSVALGNEPVRVDGEVCGRVTSGGYGYTVERSIAYAYLPPRGRARDGGRGRHLRRSGSAARSRRAAVRPARRARAGTATLARLMSVTVVGSIAFDAVRTPFGSRERMLGGSAVHFALAAVVLRHRPRGRPGRRRLRRARVRGAPRAGASTPPTSSTSPAAGRSSGAASTAGT